MSAPGVIRSGVGFRYCQVLALDANGYPAASGSPAYAGLQASGAKTLTLNDPEPVKITHTGDDRIIQADQLPPKEAVSGQFTIAKVNDTLDAVLTGQLSYLVGEMKLFGIGTDQRGDEALVCMLAYRQTKDTDPSSSNFGARRWEWRLLPKTFLIPQESNFDDNPEARVYSVNPSFVTKYPWGVSFAVGTEGFTQAQFLRGVSEYKPRIVGFLGDNVTTTFTLETTFPAQATTKMTVWSNAVLQSAGITLYTTGVKFDSAPGASVPVVIFYEHNQ